MILIETDSTFRQSEGIRDDATVDVLWDRLNKWDLGDPTAGTGYTFRDKLIKKTGWTPDHADRVTTEFRRFFFLRIRQTRIKLVPSPDVDEVWHLALLYTRRYMDMCAEFCGRFMHHNPSSSSEDKRTLRESYRNTLDAYRRTFAEDPSVGIWPQLNEDCETPPGCNEPLPCQGNCRISCTNPACCCD